MQPSSTTQRLGGLAQPYRYGSDDRGYEQQYRNLVEGVISQGLKQVL